MPLVTSCQLDFILLIWTLQPNHPYSFSFTSLTHPNLTCLPTSRLWETMSKALTKSMLQSINTTTSALLLSTQAVVSLYKVIRLVRHNQPLVNPCWLLPVTFTSFMCLEIASRRMCCPVFSRINLRLTCS